MTDDYEIDEIVCPKCRTQLHSRFCSALHCDEGEIDEYEDDPLNFAPGESYLKCADCHGTGIERWCPNCEWEWRGENLREFWI